MESYESDEFSQVPADSDSEWDVYREAFEGHRAKRIKVGEQF